MSTEIGLRLVFVLATAGTWLALAALAFGAIDLMRRIARLRVSRIIVQLRAYEQDQAALPENVLYGYPDLPWDMAGAILAVGLFLILMATAGWPIAALAGLSLRLPHLVRRTFRKEGQVRLKLLVRDFVDDLREAYAIYGSLGRALDALEEGSGQQGHGDVMMPAQPSAHFVLVEAGFALLGLKLGLDRSAHGPDLCQPQQGGVCGRIRQVVLGFANIQVASQDQPAGRPRQTIPAFPDPQGGKLVNAVMVSRSLHTRVKSCFAGKTCLYAGSP